MPVKFQTLFSRKKKGQSSSIPPAPAPLGDAAATTTTPNGNAPGTGSARRPSYVLSPSLSSGGPRIAYLYSVPLIHRLGNVVHEPDVLDTGQELQSLRKTLIESGRRLTFRAEVATVRNFRFLVTLGCRMLHYTGHGNPSCLIFESENGEANPLSTEMLTDLFRAGGVRTQLVFVSACHSESAGHSFAAAGVPHVVAVKFDEKVTDYAARVFAEQFYLSLVTGNTVRNSFQIGVTSIMAESSVSAHNDDKKFLLLPEDGNHDVAIFGTGTNAAVHTGSLLDETPRPVKNTVHKPPVFFLGRNAKVQECVSLLYPPQRYRCVTVRGEPGIGKTALAFRACEYMGERRMFDALYQVSLNETHFHPSGKEALCETIGTALEVGGARNSRDLLRALQGNDPTRRVLLLLDGIDRFLTHGSALIPVLSFLLGKHYGLHLLLTAEGSLNENGDGLLENTPEKVVELGALSEVNAAHLLVYVAPRRLRFEEMSSSSSSSATTTITSPSTPALKIPTTSSNLPSLPPPHPVPLAAAKTEALTQLSSSPVLRELHGHPKAILMFAPLLEAHRLEGLLEGAKRCYREASSNRGEGGREGGGEGGGGGGLKMGGGMMSTVALTEMEKEEEEACALKQFNFKDVACAKLWAELTSSSSSSSSMLGGGGGTGREGGSQRRSSLSSSTSSASSSFLSLGVPWYRLAAALQVQLKEMLLRESGERLLPASSSADLLASKMQQSSFSLQDADTGSSSSSLPRDTTPLAPPTLFGGGAAAAGHSTSTSSSNSSSRSLKTGRASSNGKQQQQQQHQQPQHQQQRRNSGRASSLSLSRGGGGRGGSGGREGSRNSLVEGVRGLSDNDITFLRSKLALQPNSDMVTAKDFEAFSQWWVPVVTALKHLVREWLCETPTQLIMGFAGRKEAEVLLKEKPIGTFLIRFSTTHLGLLAISFVAAPPTSPSSAPPPPPSVPPSLPPSNPIQHCLVRVSEAGCELFMEPGRKRYENLQELIYDVASLTHFYPDVPEEVALEALQQATAAAGAAAAAAATASAVSAAEADNVARPPSR